MIEATERISKGDFKVHIQESFDKDSDFGILQRSFNHMAKELDGIEMFRNEQVNIPVAGVVENMAWFTPEELPENRYYLFGRGGARRVAEEYGVPFLGEIPIVQSIMEGGDEGKPASVADPRVEEWYRAIADKLIGTVMKNG